MGCGSALLAFLYNVCREIDYRKGRVATLLLSAGRFPPYGRIAVAIFIAFWLLLIVTRCSLQTGQLSGSWPDYSQTSRQTSLPPYYTALVLSVLFGWC